eukprot:scaffold8306_cov171-Amphora_coffeaeformis.AAC.6
MTFSQLLTCLLRTKSDTLCKIFRTEVIPYPTLLELELEGYKSNGVRVNANCLTNPRVLDHFLISSTNFSQPDEAIATHSLEWEKKKTVMVYCIETNLPNTWLLDKYPITTRTSIEEHEQ